MGTYKNLLIEQLESDRIESTDILGDFECNLNEVCMKPLYTGPTDNPHADFNKWDKEQQALEDSIERIKQRAKELALNPKVLAEEVFCDVLFPGEEDQKAILAFCGWYACQAERYLLDLPQDRPFPGIFHEKLEDSLFELAERQLAEEDKYHGEPDGDD